MKNYVTGYEYSGQNVQILYACGYEEDDAFVTFKQAVKLPKVSGKKLKGLKAAARLMRLKTITDEVTGTPKKVPSYYSVFDVKEVLARAAA